MAHVDNLRRHFPGVRHVTYLNTGTSGVMPDSSLEAMRTVLRNLSEEVHGYSKLPRKLAEVLYQVKEQFASLIQSPVDNIALYHHIGQAMDALLFGSSFADGDNVVCLNGISDDVLLPLYAFKQRRTASVRILDSTPGESLVTRIRALVNERTRFIICPHVSAQTGERIPLHSVAEIAREVGAYLVVDGSFGVGCDAINVTNLEIDFYTMPGNKWLCGPADTAGVYVSNRLLQNIHPTHVRLHNLVDPTAVEPLGSFLLTSTAQRLEESSTSLLNWTGMLESLHFLRVSVGWDYAYARIEGLTGLCIDGLMDISSVRLLTPRDARAGSIVFTSENGLDCERLCREAEGREMVVHPLHRNRAVRVTIGFYNSEHDITRFVQFVKSSLK